MCRDMCLMQTRICSHKLTCKDAYDGNGREPSVRKPAVDSFYLHTYIHTHIYMYTYARAHGMNTSDLTPTSWYASTYITHTCSHQRWHTLFLSVIKKIISLHIHVHVHFSEHTWNKPSVLTPARWYASTMDLTCRVSNLQHARKY